MSAAVSFYGSRYQQGTSAEVTTVSAASENTFRQWMGKARVQDLVAARTPKHQAPLQGTRVKRYAQTFDLAKVGMVEVRIDEHGVWWLEDGQHRVQAAVLAGLKDAEFDVRFTAGVDSRRAAELYIGINDRKPKPVGALIQARAEAGDELAAEMFAIVEQHGFAVKLIHNGWASAPNVLKCPQLLLKLLDEHGHEHLGEVLWVLRFAWDGDAVSTHNDIIRGISLFLLAYPEVESQKLAVKLAAVPAKAVLSEAASARVIERNSNSVRKGYAPGRGVLEIWNKNKKSGRLEDRFNDFGAAIDKRVRAARKGQGSL